MTVHISPEVEQAAQDVLRQMLADGVTTARLPGPPDNLELVIDGESETSSVLTFITIPEDLMEQLAGKKVYLTMK